MSKVPPTDLTNPNATGSGRHVPTYPPEQLEHVESQRFKARSPYWEKNQGDDDEFFSSIDETLPPFGVIQKLDYKPLSKPHWIRVLKIEPGIYTAVKCSLIHVNLDDNEHDEYEALSYTWGAYYDNPKEEYLQAAEREGVLPFIVCDNVWVEVTQSLSHALQLFRRTDRARYLWADYLCINQSDPVERGYQVSLMQLIYKQAREVLVWVGWCDAYSIENAMHLLCWLVNQECSDVVKASNVKRAIWYDDEEPIEKPQIAARPSSESSFYSADEEPVDPDKEVVVFEPANLKPLIPFFEARYFSRLWVFQEIALSPLATVFWGRARMRFEWVALVADLIERRYMAEFASFDNALTGLDNCAKMYRTWKGVYANDSFFDLLLATRGLKAQEPVDKIFGLLGIKTRDSEPVDGKRFVEADYKATKYDVFRGVAEKVLVGQQDIRCLAAVEHREGGWKEEEASWVPDFGSLGEVFLPALSAQVNDNTVTRISRSEGCGMRDCLTFEGFQIDILDQVIDTGLPLTSHWRSAEILESLQRLMADLRLHYPDEAIALCLTAGFTTSMTSAVSDLSAHVAAMDAFSTWSEHIELTDKNIVSPPQDSATRESKSAYKFFQASAKAVQRRCLFRTQSGLLGLGPNGVRMGDGVVVLLGGNVPFVLRTEDKNHWRLVGQSYVYGLMEKQVIEDSRVSGRGSRDFHLF
jgi:hypothetical protein